MKNQFEKSFPKTPISFHNRVAETLETLPEKKGNTMSIFNKKRYYLVAAAIVALLSTTAIAVSSGVFSSFLSSTSSTSSTPNYTTFASLSTVQKDVGIKPKIVETFSNGYTFNLGSIADTTALGDNDEVLAKYKELYIQYKKGSTILDVITYPDRFSSLDNAQIIAKTSVDDIEISIFKFAMKFVPPDYVMTETDKADEASGKYSFSYGSTKVGIDNLTFVTWADNDICYSIMARNSDLTNDDLFSMAKEIIAVE